MRYRSTRDSSLSKSFSEILLGGLAPDGGLYMPKSLRKFSIEEINELENSSYEELTSKILYQFVEEEITREEFNKIISTSYIDFQDKDIVSLVNLEEKKWILELFHGPTLAFKDIAMQLLGALLGYFTNRDKAKIAVLGATSGDTGSAAISALSRYQNIEVFILYPQGRVTEIQRKQMTTSQSNNVHPLAVETDFDGCQSLVKELFLDKELLSNTTKFIAANSINWSRCMAQSVYYFWTYLKLKDQAEQLSFSVPSGNFGHAYAGWLAKQMGLPISRILVATNSNNVLHKLFLKRVYKKGNVNQTLAPSMDISVASNFERLLYNLYKNKSEKVRDSIKDFPDKEIYLSDDQWNLIQDFFSSYSSSDEEILEEIRNAFLNNGYLLDPHTATGVKAMNELARKNESMVTMATAHPAKFEEAINQALPGEDIPVPPQLSSIVGAEEKFVVLPNDIDKIREYILRKIG
ncbi:MAG: threonine synthase [Gammaproteobacteria bacterium]|nr:MAG: threonine synthase [Gammaproteobacteria bacterium]